MQTEWKAFAASPPGQRFKDRYHRKRDAVRPTWKKLVSPVLGILIAVLGLILLPAPGPGIPVVLFGLAWLAESFLWMARFLDLCEPPIRSIANMCLRWWKDATPSQRWVVGVAIILLVLTTGGVLFLLLT